MSRVERHIKSALHSVASEVASPGNADIWAWLKFLCGVLTRKSDIAAREPMRTMQNAATELH